MAFVVFFISCALERQRQTSDKEKCEEAKKKLRASRDSRVQLINTIERQRSVTFRMKEGKKTFQRVAEAMMSRR